MGSSNTGKEQSCSGSDVWQHFNVDQEAPELAIRESVHLDSSVKVQPNPDGMDVMLEQWDAGSSEPPHYHPGDDMTIVAEGKMSVQFYTQSENGLVRDGNELILCAGDTGYIKARRIHSVQYIEPCKLVYVHSGVFGYQEAGAGDHG